MTTVGNIAYGVAVSYKFCGKELDRMNGMDWYDSDGQEVFAATYDPWGRQTITKNDISFHRDYCGHEMLPDFGLINMNGRVYDPLLGRFLSPDPYVQDPLNPQCYNRYAYCMNNPVNYTDPSGNSWISSHWKSIVSSAVSISVSAIAIGAGGGIILAGMAGGVAGGLTSSVLYGNNFETTLQSVCIGATMGGLSAGLNNAAASPNLATSILRHAGVNAMLTAVQGGDVAQGALMGGFSALSNNLLDNYAGVLGPSGLVAASAFSGGILSSITGGDFAQGAITGAYGMIFNEMMHPYSINVEKIKEDIEKDGVLTFAEAYRWYTVGKGGIITVDASKVNLNFIDISEYEIDKWQDVDTKKGGWKQFLVYGTIRIMHKGNGVFKIDDDIYDFDMHSWNSVREITRNIETFISSVLHGRGTPFNINFKGNNLVK